MIRRYDSPEELSRLGWPPRIIVSLRITEDPFEIGFNWHYSLDSNRAEMLADFFIRLGNQHPKATFDIKDLQVYSADTDKIPGGVGR